MKKKQIKTKEVFDLALKNHKKNDLKTAVKLYKKILIHDPNHFEANFYFGSLLFELKDLKKAKNLLEKAIKVKPDHASVHFSLGNVFRDLGEHKKARYCFEKAIEIQPRLVGAQNNLGNIFKEQGDYDKAQKCFKEAIEIQPNLLAAYNNLGIVYQFKKNYEEAILNFKKAIQINPKISMSHYNLGKVYKEMKNYLEAIKCFEMAKTKRSVAELLESTYFFNGLKTYPEILKKVIKEDPLNLRVAALAAYVSKKENIKNIYPFCKNPLEYIFISNLEKEIDSSKKIFPNLTRILDKTDLIWEPTAKTTTHGYHSSGNLFNNKDEAFLQLQKIIKKQINIYRKKFKLSKEYFITKWPTKNNIEAWHVRLMKTGYQKAHIHPAGWLSGCFYLRIPKILKGNEGAIKFQLSGYDYPFDKKLPTLIHKPKNFDIALFPSSLFHETIPFNSKEERHVIAFDIVPK